MLVIPAIDLQRGHCVRFRNGELEEERVYFDDPVQMAKLWRVQNAKVLHLMNRDQDELAKDEDNLAVIRQIVAALDIPVQAGGRVRTLDDIEALFEAGVYRVEIASTATHDADFVQEAVQRFSGSRLVVGLALDAPDALEHALDLEQRGVCRLIAADPPRSGCLTGPNIEGLRALATQLTRARVTAAGGVGGYRDLLALQALEPLGVDSVIVARALYENRFPCQRFWAWHDKEHLDLDHFSTAPLQSGSA